ncbi:hypothetical protein [Alloactinosynnema sp. L-07]|nr:hypothetical protein [Alloactinosynnema sp. L-07]
MAELATAVPYLLRRCRGAVDEGWTGHDDSGDHSISDLNGFDQGA